MAEEIERKFLVAFRPYPIDAPFNYIRQGYISTDKSAVVRVRISDSKGFVTIKGEKINGAGLEFEYEIPLTDAKTLLDTFCHGSLIEKKRYTVTHGKNVWEIDEFLKKNAGLILAEIELEKPDQEFELPEWIKEEVTHDPRYYNSNLNDHPFICW